MLDDVPNMNWFDAVVAALGPIATEFANEAFELAPTAMAPLASAFPDPSDTAPAPSAFAPIPSAVEFSPIADDWEPIAVPPPGNPEVDALAPIATEFSHRVEALLPMAVLLYAGADAPGPSAKFSVVGLVGAHCAKACCEDVSAANKSRTAVVIDARLKRKAPNSRRRKPPADWR